MYDHRFPPPDEPTPTPETVPCPRRLPPPPVPREYRERRSSFAATAARVAKHPASWVGLTITILEVVLHLLRELQP